MDTIGKISEQTGVNVETIRYYEKCGLLAKPSRTAGKHRIYDAVQKSRLVFIRRSRELGFSLQDIRNLLKAADGKLTCRTVYDLTRRHLHDVKAKIHDLRRLERVLAETSKKCSKGDIPECPIIEAIANSQLLR
ncbi:MAG: helix-turn-helix domain-containing protein [Rhodospirillaceae bacterium]|nr:helix-turn-helix domain-containing protein [Rhodospirillaceae bacterium]